MRKIVDRCETDILSNYTNSIYTSLALRNDCDLKIGALVNEPYIYGPGLSQKGVDLLLLNVILTKIGVLGKIQYYKNYESEAVLNHLING